MKIMVSNTKEDNMKVGIFMMVASLGFAILYLAFTIAQVFGEVNPDSLRTVIRIFMIADMPYILCIATTLMGAVIIWKNQKKNVS